MTSIEPASVDAELLAILAVGVGLAVVHVLPHWIGPFDEEDRAWMSVVSGVVIAFVFLELIPEIVDLAEVLVQSNSSLATAFGEHVHFVVLVGFLVFFGIESAALERENEAYRNPSTVLWAHVGLFSLYNFMVGYKIAHHHVFLNVSHVSVFFVALGLHFLVTDFGLAAHHGAAYEAIGRWIVAMAIVVGTVFGLLWQIDVNVALLAAFVAGGILFNLINHEIRSPSQSRFALLTGGAFVFGIVYLLT